MDSQVTPFLDFIGSKDISIPFYQRNYTWEERLCKVLFEDLMNLTTPDSPSIHYFGTIICSANPDTSVAIVDGQQRTVSVSLLLVALRESVKDGIIRSDDPGIVDRIDRILLRWDGRPRVSPIKRDYREFESIVCGNIPEKRSEISVNYEFFRNYLKRYSKRFTADGFLHAIGKLRIVIIYLETSKGDNAQAVFDSINSKHQELEDSDRIRNFLFMSRSMKEQDEVYSKYWVKLEDNAGNGNRDLSSFFRNYLTIKFRSVPSSKNMYPVFRRQFTNTVIGDYEGYMSLFDEMLGYSVLYRRLKNPEELGDERLCRTMTHLNYLRLDSAYPFLMRILHESESRPSEFDKKTLEMAFSLIENYLVRSKILQMKEKGRIWDSLDRTMATLFDTVEHLGNGSFIDRLTYVITHKTSRVRYPLDRDIRPILDEGDFYNGNRSLGIEVLTVIEGSNLDTEDIVARAVKKKLTVEHIIPQSRTPEWREYLGPNAENIFNKWMHRLGNLTLTAYNSNLSDRPYPEKRIGEEFGYVHSGLLLNSWMRESEIWNESLIRERHGCMVDRFLHNMPELHTGYVPKDIPEEETLGIFDDFSGKDVVAYIIEGTETECGSTMEAYVGVLGSIYNDNPRGIESITIGDGTQEPLFCTKSEVYQVKRRIGRYKPLDDAQTLYVCIDYVDTKKMSIVKDVVEQLDLDLDISFIVRSSAGPTSARGPAVGIL